MPAQPAPGLACLEIVFSDRPWQAVSVDELPFLIGRGRENGNHLPIDDLRISRRCAALCAAPDGIRIEDRGQLNGIFVNGAPTKETTLRDGDKIRLGMDDGCQLVFRLRPEAGSGQGATPDLRALLGSLEGDSADELKRLRLVLDAASLLQSRLPLESVLATILDHAIAITAADRAMFLEPDSSGTLQVRVAREGGGLDLEPETMNPSRTALRQAVEQRCTVVNEDLNLADLNLKTAQSVLIQLLRSAVVIPLYGKPREDSPSGAARTDPLLGAIYLDSRRTSAFSALDREILDALGAQAASVLESALMVQREREKQRMEQELDIARKIQQALVPQGLKDFPHLAVTGLHRPCSEVGGDYFDVFPLPDGRNAILIADVSGKGLGAALLTTMLQGTLSGMTLGVDPVKVFNHLNLFLCEHAEVGRYATMFFGLLDSAGTLEFVRAGHPSPLLLRRGKVSELYSGGSFPVGLAEEATFKSSRYQLEPEDTLLLFTDGVTEAQDKSANLFGMERLIDTFRRYPDSSLHAIQAGILAAVESFSAGAKQSDDITLLVVRYRQPADIGQAPV